MEGFKVITAENGALGLSMIREKRPDIVLCDIMMPGIDGHSVLEFLRNDPDLAEIAFIFVSALGTRHDLRRGMSGGADDYLPKPFSADELVAAVVGRLQRINVIRSGINKPEFLEEQTIIRRELTPRECEILLLVGKGVTSKEIAERLGIRPNAVEVHRSNLMKKLNAENAAVLARWAFIAELATPSA
jgi:DNA-binding NarL/FixJ family response regulator